MVLESADERELRGTVERVTFHNEETGFCVLRVRVPQIRELVTLTGTLSSVHSGEWVSARGSWHMDVRYGRQFKASFLEVRPPESVEGMESYLASGVVPGIGKAMARRLVKAFGEEVFRIIEEEPQKLEEVEGIGPGRSASISKAWTEQKQLRHIMVFLHSYGVGTNRAFRIYRRYGEKAVEKIQEDPYCLARDIVGMGFTRADKIAEAMGFPKDSPLRCQAGLAFVLRELTGQGHCAFPKEKLEEKATELLGVAPEVVREALAVCVNNGSLREHRDERAVPKEKTSFLVYLPALDDRERYLARDLLRLCRTGEPPILHNQQKALNWAEEKNSILLGDSQRKALLTALSFKVSIITGGPGVGKTTIIKVLCTLFKGAGKKIALCAPTGRAAKRMGEATGEDARTIHRLLEFDPVTRGFKRNYLNPLEEEVCIVDEMSMVDITLGWQFVRALSPESTLIMVGDADQLPSVGPGKVLRDCIDSGVVPVARLDTIYRQAATSAIITNAHRVNRGEYPLFPEKHSPLGDFYMVQCADPQRGVELILRMVTQRIPARFGLHPVKDIQILSPMTRGHLGVFNLNGAMQEKLNPQGPSVERFGTVFREKDKVLQVVNNYDKGVYNGDVGFIEKVSSESREVLVGFGGKELSYSFEELDELVLSYAMSIHKSQGSEYKGVIIPVHTQHYMLLQRNLLYTGITRGKELVVLVGTPKALHLCLNRVESLERVTTLKERLCQEYCFEEGKSM